MSGPRRALVCLQTIGQLDDLCSEVESAGYLVQDLGADDDPRALAEGIDDAVVILHEGVDDWVRMVADQARSRPRLRPVLPGAVDNPDQFLSAVAAGIVGLCSAGVEVAALVWTIEGVRTTCVAVLRGLAGPLLAEGRHGRDDSVSSASGTIDLADREWDLMQHPMQAGPTREIAQILFVSVGTVTSHVSALS